VKRAAERITAGKKRLFDTTPARVTCISQTMQRRSTSGISEHR
jgi:hypothetical protein